MAKQCLGCCTYKRNTLTSSFAFSESLPLWRISVTPVFAFCNVITLTHTHKHTHVHTNIHTHRQWVTRLCWNSSQRPILWKVSLYRVGFRATKEEIITSDHHLTLTLTHSTGSQYRHWICFTSVVTMVLTVVLQCKSSTILFFWSELIDR